MPRRSRRVWSSLAGLQAHLQWCVSGFVNAPTALVFFLEWLPPHYSPLSFRRIHGPRSYLISFLCICSSAPLFLSTQRYHRPPFLSPHPQAQLDIPDDLAAELGVGAKYHLACVAQKFNERTICGWAKNAGKCVVNQPAVLDEFEDINVPMDMLYLIDERENMFSIQEFAEDAGETDFAHDWFDAGGRAIFFASHNALDGRSPATLDASHVLQRVAGKMELVNLGTNV